jgi:Leucine-rich repeat (LRR) protein
VFRQVRQSGVRRHLYITVYSAENSLTSLDGIEKLNNLVSFRFDGNQVDNLLPFQNLTSMRYISGNCNQIKSLKGLENLKDLRSLSLCTYNII